MLLAHGAGGYSGALWPIAVLVVSCGIDISAVNLSLYGRTKSPDPAAMRYNTWVGPLIDLVETERGYRPLVLLGVSIDDLLPHEVTAHPPCAATVAATCLLESDNWRARVHITRAGALGVLSGPSSTLT